MKKLSFNLLLKWPWLAIRFVLEKMLLLLVVLFDKRTPNRTRLTITGSLVYLLVPVDLIPDFTPIFGYCDDLMTIFGSLLHIYISCDSQHVALAKQKTAKIFGH